MHERREREIERGTGVKRLHFKEHLIQIKKSNKGIEENRKWQNPKGKS